MDHRHHHSIICRFPVTPASVAQLVADGHLEPVAADITAAWNQIDEAKRHLESSAKLTTTDDSLAHVALYDAARKVLRLTDPGPARNWRG